MCRVVGLFEQLRAIDKINPKSATTRLVILASSDLDETATPKLIAVTNLSIAKTGIRVVTELVRRRTPNLPDIVQAPRLMPNLSKKHGLTIRRANAVLLHGFRQAWGVHISQIGRAARCSLENVRFHLSVWP